MLPLVRDAFELMQDDRLNVTDWYCCGCHSQEADVIERLVSHLVQKSGLSPGDLGIISPYAAQVSLLSRRLSDKGYTINSRGGLNEQDGMCTHSSCTS